MSRSSKELYSLKEKLTDFSIYIGLFAGLPIVLIKVYQSFIDGYGLESWLALAVYCSFALIAFLRRWINYRVRAVISVSLMFFVTFFGLMHLGFTLAAFVASLSSSILTLCILGKKEGIIIALITCGTGMLVSFVFNQGDAGGVGNTVELIEFLNQWWPQLLAFMAFYLTIAISIMLFETSLLNTIRELQEQKSELEHVNRELLDSKALAEEGSRAKSQFISVMSHELKTPLNPVFGLLNLLKNEPLNEDSLEYVEMMENSSQELLDILNEILDFVELDEEKLRAEVQSFSIKDLCKDVVDEYLPLAERKGLRLLSRFHSGVEGVDDIEIDSDPKRLRQLIANLVSNAVKFTERGTVRLTIEREAHPQYGCGLKITVSDTGMGIAPAMQKQIFEPFTQAADANTRKCGGIGLGLNIAVKIVQLLSGEITLESKEGVGSAFTVQVPCKMRPLARHQMAETIG